MAKKFYGIAGTNGYGVYDNYDKVLGSRKYVKGYKIKSFNSLIDAKEYAVNTYESMQNGASDFYRIGSLKNLNLFYYQKPVKKLFIQIWGCR